MTFVIDSYNGVSYFDADNNDENIIISSCTSPSTANIWDTRLLHDDYGIRRCEYCNRINYKHEETCNGCGAPL